MPSHVYVYMHLLQTALKTKQLSPWFHSSLNLLTYLCYRARVKACTASSDCTNSIDTSAIKKVDLFYLWNDFWMGRIVQCKLDRKCTTGVGRQNLMHIISPDKAKLTFQISDRLVGTLTQRGLKTKMKKWTRQTLFWYCAIILQTCHSSQHFLRIMTVAGLTCSETHSTLK